MEECCKVMGHSTDAETDFFIPYFIRLQKFADDINRSFDYDETLGLPELDTTRIEVIIKGFNDQLSTIEATFPSEIWNNCKHPAYSKAHER